MLIRSIEKFLRRHEMPATVAGKKFWKLILENNWRYNDTSRPFQGICNGVAAGALRSARHRVLEPPVGFPRPFDRALVGGL